MNKTLTIIIGIIVVATVIYGGYRLSNHTSNTMRGSGKVTVVAAENFYGDIAKQLGGDKVQVTSILSNPDEDPHEYEPTVQDGVTVSKAQIVIENGSDYDTWMNKLLSASPNNNRTVIVAFAVAPRKLEDNPHIWYGVDNVKAIAAQITDSLRKQDSADASTFDQNLTTFDNSLQALQQKMDQIKASYANSPVALTETIFLYQTQTMQLKVLTPLAFEQAIA